MTTPEFKQFELNAEWLVMGEHFDGDDLKWVQLEVKGFGGFGYWRDHGEYPNGTAMRVAECLNACRGIEQPELMRRLLERVVSACSEYYEGGPIKSMCDFADAHMEALRAVLNEMGVEIPKHESYEENGSDEQAASNH